ncbi:hypothetical protein [Clostridium sp. BNL1100]|uniref:hypothetical protein n=1 Tax=Clostridium sp. BNL1100 TaxID=755731 RepID=UPI00024A7F35|nr:hypothetical protein [Clostridium sp. BNL1100]AEY65838.1 hypothetical protein Clo1100_1625 [Clostridium sp. BNL1100]
MGSSTRKIQAKIKKILSPGSHDDSYTVELDKAIPLVMIETLRMRKTRKYFGDKDFLNLMTGGVQSVQALGGGKVKEFFSDEDFDFSKDIGNDLETERVLESILNKIENDIEDIDSSLLLKAFKITMTKILMEKNFDLYYFVNDFCVNALFLIVMENINESVIDTYDEKQVKDYDSKIKLKANQWVDKNLKDTILEYINEKITINELIDTLTKKVENSKGDFDE